MHTSGYCPYTDIFPKSVSIDVDETILAIGDEIVAEASNGVSDSRKITVNEVTAEKIEIVVDNTMICDDSVQANVLFYPQNTTVQDIVWEVDDSEIAVIDEDGIITAKKVGKIKVTAIQKDVTDSCEIQVLPRKVETIEIITPIEEKLEKGENVQLSAVVLPDNATYPQLSWKSSNPDVVSVDEEGNIEAISVGNAVITAYTQDGCSDTCEIVVSMSTSEVLLALIVIVAVGGSTTIVVKKTRRKKSNYCSNGSSSNKPSEKL